MIKLDVQDYCQRCPFFETVTTSWPDDVRNSEGRVVSLRPGETVITCKNADRCYWVVREALRLKESNP